MTYYEGDKPPFETPEQQEQFRLELQALLERYRVTIGVCIEELVIENAGHQYPIEVQIYPSPYPEQDSRTHISID